VCVCTVTNFSGQDKASGVKFCRLVQGNSHFGERRSPRSSKLNELALGGKCYKQTPVPSTDGALAVSGGHWRLSAILALGMCGYMAVPENGRTCFCFHCSNSNHRSMSIMFSSCV